MVKLTLLKNLSKSLLAVICALFSLALFLRLLFLFLVSGLEYCGWYHDSYHHWQIAYYSLHVGFKQNPPRMWDLNGMEYFWGLLPTLTESFLLWLFNTTSIAPFRIFNSIMGSLSACLIYLLGKKYFDEQTGLFSAVLVAVCPILWEVDTSGMLEPTGVILLLFALLVYDRSPFACGLFLGLASLCHIEFWFLALGVCSFYLIFKRSAVSFVPSVLGWLTPMTPYFYFMQTRTGDWLYALKYNYFCNVIGKWLDTSLPPKAQILPRSIAAVLLVLSAAILLYLIKNRPRGYVLHVFFWVFIAMQGAIFGLTAYITPYLIVGQVSRLLIDRLFAINYYYLSLMAALALQRFSARFSACRMGISYRSFIFLFIVIVYLSSLMLVVQQYFSGVYYVPYAKQMRTADWIASHRNGGSVISSLVILNYRLIRNGVPYDIVFGSLYSPRHYGSENITESYLWLRKLNVTLVVVDQNIIENFPLLENRPDDFPPFHIRTKPPEYEYVYYVNQTELKSILAESQG
jgi:hypothetical protein